MAKFISRSSNLLVVLKPGIPAQPITGTPPVPTVSVRFEDGMANVEDNSLVELMKSHPGFNGDFILATDEAFDPYIGQRQATEPAHIVMEMVHGAPATKIVTGKLGNVSPDVERLIREQAMEIAKNMLPQMVKATLEDLVSARQEAKKVEEESTPEETVSIAVEEVPAPKKRGPKPKSK
jgi:hypothetical protein